MRQVVKVEAIYEYMARNNLSVKAFQEKAHITRTMYECLMNDSLKSNLNALFLVAREMDVSIVDIIRAEEVDE